MRMIGFIAIWLRNAGKTKIALKLAFLAGLTLASCDSATTPSPSERGASDTDTGIASHLYPIQEGTYRYSYKSDDTPFGLEPPIKYRLDLTLAHHQSVDTLHVHSIKDSSWRLVGPLPSGGPYNGTVHIDTTYSLTRSGDTAKGICGFPDFVSQFHIPCDANGSRALAKQRTMIGGAARMVTYSTLGSETVWAADGLGMIKAEVDFDAWHTSYYGSAKLDLCSIDGVIVSPNVIFQTDSSEGCALALE